MKSPILEKEKIIKDVRNLFRLKKLKKQTIDITIKDIKNLFRPEKNEEMKDKILRDVRDVFRLEKRNKAIKDIILRNIRNLFENEEEENYYKPIAVSIFWSNNYIEYESNGDRNKTLSAEEYLNKIRPYLKDIINNLKKSDKRQSIIENDFISSIDNDEERVMHLKDSNIKTMINDKADEVIEKRFESLKNRDQNNLESVRGSEFVFDYVHLLYCKCHKINQNHGGSYIDSPYWIKNKKATVNPINKKDNKYSQYVITVALNLEEIKKDLQRVTKI